MCRRHHIFLATLVVTITGNTYGCVRTPTRVGIPSTDDDSTYTPLPHDHRKSAGPARGTARAVGRADDGRATDLARGRHPPVGVPSRHCSPRRRDRSMRCANPLRRFFFLVFFTRAFASIARANATSRVGLETARMDGWVDIISAGRAERGVRMDGMDDDGVARSRARMNERVDVIFLRVIREETSSRARRGARTRRDRDVPFIPSSVGRSSIHPETDDGEIGKGDC